MSNLPNNAGKDAFKPKTDRHEKGSAMELIAGDAKAMEAKSARLKALRLDRDAKDAAIAAAAEKPVKVAVKRKRKAAAA